MLVLCRREGQSIEIDGGIKITVVSNSCGRVRLGIEAPKGIGIRRDDAKRTKPPADDRRISR